MKFNKLICAIIAISILAAIVSTSSERSSRRIRKAGVDLNHKCNDKDLKCSDTLKCANYTRKGLNQEGEKRCVEKNTFIGEFQICRFKASDIVLGECDNGLKCGNNDKCSKARRRLR